MHFRKHSWTAAACAGTLTAAVLPGVAVVCCAISLPLHGRMYFQMASASIYSDTANAHEDIRQAILTAAAEHKHVLLVLGANWCVDCHVLDLYFHDPGNASLLAANYILVDVSVSEYDRNLDLARKVRHPAQ